MNPGATSAEPFLLIVLSSPSGAGKTTLARRLLAAQPELRFSVSHTTRPPRPNEVDGRDYHFVSPEAFDAMVAADAFAEWATVHSNRYGTSKNEIEAARSSCGGIVFDIDFQGARQLQAAYADLVTVFVLPPSMKELERRLRGRATDDAQAVARRLEQASVEIANYGLFQYLLLNDDFDRAFARLQAIVSAERCRRQRLALVAERLLRHGKTEP
ncbi:MAG: guanylate kinase [Deltaproteobacteria bacterium]|nr:guanylate kinase [Deltaproteobacteria bacterium]